MIRHWALIPDHDILFKCGDVLPHYPLATYM